MRRVRATATALLPETATLAEQMLAYLLARIPEAGADEEIEGLTLGSCSSNVEQALSMIRHRIPVSATEAPVTALEHARAMAARGHSVDVMLRFYRLGHSFFMQRLHRELLPGISDPQARLAVLEELERFGFEYVDAISSQVAAEYVAELERRQNRARAVRTDVVRALLSGTRIDVDGAERSLAHRLTGPQLAFVCWAPRGDVDLVPVGSAIAGLLGAERPLLQPDGAQTLWGWVAGSAADDADVPDVTGTLGAGDAAVHVAFGEVQHGAAGFRASHLEALRAQRVVRLSGRAAPSVTRFARIALIDALSQDVHAARALVARELGRLMGTGAREAEERAAVLALLDASGSLVAAGEALGIHRNTVLQRVRRAERRRGRSAHDDALELHVALRLFEAIGSDTFDLG